MPPKNLCYGVPPFWEKSPAQRTFTIFYFMKSQFSFGSRVDRTSCLSCDFEMPHGLRFCGVSCDVSIPLDCHQILHSGSDVGLAGCFRFRCGRDWTEPWWGGPAWCVEPGHCLEISISGDNVPGHAVELMWLVRKDCCCALTGGYNTGDSETWRAGYRQERRTPLSKRRLEVLQPCCAGSALVGELGPMHWIGPLFEMLRTSSSDTSGGSSAARGGIRSWWEWAGPLFPPACCCAALAGLLAEAGKDAELEVRSPDFALTKKQKKEKDKRKNKNSQIESQKIWIRCGPQRSQKTKQGPDVGHSN